MISFAWAKLQAPGGALTVADHGEDVAAVFRILAGAECYGRGLRVVAGRDLTEQDLDRLCALVFLHDMGKCNAGFWRRQFSDARIVGHTEQMRVPWLLERGPGMSGLMDAVLDTWQAYDHFAAAMAHHGRPLDFLWIPRGDGNAAEPDGRQMEAEWQRLWAPQEGYDPATELGAVIAAARARFPHAFEPGGPLPQAARFVSLFAGLVTLADWIGSDTERFAINGPRGMARRAFAANMAARAVDELGLSRRDWGAGGIGEVFDFHPWESQRRAGEPELGQVAVLEAETGSGKTEAALWRFLCLARAGAVDTLYFALPTRTAAVQLHGRLVQFFKRVFGAGAPAPVLAVPGYIRAGEAEGRMLAPFEVLWPDDADDAPERWAAESPKRYLAGRVAVGTVDQALLAGLRVKHAHLRAATMSRALLVVDEVHASDSYMSEILKSVIDNHVATGGHVLLLSATLGGELRAELTGAAAPGLDEAEATPYPALSGSARVPVRVEAGAAKAPVSLALDGIMSAPERIAAAAVEAAGRGASVLVLRNRVADAVAVAQVVEALGGPSFTLGGAASVHHGRFAPEDRRLLDARVEQIFGKNGAKRAPVVLCGTQTLEQSLDIDADFLITDLAPMDVLLQRLGRLHRHRRARPGGFEAPRVLVLTPAERDLRVLESWPRHGLGPLRDGQGIYPDLAVIEATWAELKRIGEIAVPGDCRRLVERSLHSEARMAAAARAGLEETALNQRAMIGAEIRQAKNARLDMRLPFREMRFADKLEGAISTRLGMADLLVDLPDRPIGPFGAAISRLPVPAWMSGGISAEDAASVRPGDGRLEVCIGAARFVYDRFGLEKG